MQKKSWELNELGAAPISPHAHLHPPISRVRTPTFGGPICAVGLPKRLDFFFLRIHLEKKEALQVADSTRPAFAPWRPPRCLAAPARRRWRPRPPVRAAATWRRPAAARERLPAAMFGFGKDKKRTPAEQAAKVHADLEKIGKLKGAKPAARLQDDSSRHLRQVRQRARGRAEARREHLGFGRRRVAAVCNSSGAAGGRALAGGGGPTAAERLLGEACAGACEGRVSSQDRRGRGRRGKTSCAEAPQSRLHCRGHRAPGAACGGGWAPVHLPADSHGAPDCPMPHPCCAICLRRRTRTAPWSAGCVGSWWACSAAARASPARTTSRARAVRRIYPR